MLRLLLLFALVAMGYTQTCPTGWAYDAASCSCFGVFAYNAADSRATRARANVDSQCNARAAGARIANFQTAAQWNLATGMFAGAGLTNANFVWIGATDSGSEGTWRWSDGNSLTGGFTNWMAGRGPGATNTNRNDAVGGPTGWKDVGLNYPSDTAPQGYSCQLQLSCTTTTSTTTTTTTTTRPSTVTRRFIFTRIQRFPRYNYVRRFRFSPFSNVRFGQIGGRYRTNTRCRPTCVPVPNNATWQTVTNADLAGNTRCAPTVTTAAACQAACTANPNCWGVSFNPARTGSPCALSSCSSTGCPTVPIRTGVTGSTVFRRVCPTTTTTTTTTTAPTSNIFTPPDWFPSPYTAPPGYCLLPGYRTNGGTFNDANTLAGCQAACDADPNCFMFDAFTATNQDGVITCWLHITGGATNVCSDLEEDRGNIQIRKISSTCPNHTVSCVSTWTR